MPLRHSDNFIHGIAFLVPSPNLVTHDSRFPSSQCFLCDLSYLRGMKAFASAICHQEDLVLMEEQSERSVRGSQKVPRKRARRSQ